MQRTDSDEPYRDRPHRAHRHVGVPGLLVQAGFVVAVLLAVVVASYPVAAGAALVVTVAGVRGCLAAARFLRRAADREATVRVPGVAVEVTLARAAGD
jgi:hypothetical protein